MTDMVVPYDPVMMEPVIVSMVCTVMSGMDATDKMPVVLHGNG